MEIEEKNKIKNICKAIIKERGHFLKLLLSYSLLLESFKFNNSLEKYYLLFSSINFNKLNEYCWFGNFPKDEYIFYYYYSKIFDDNKYYTLDFNVLYYKYNYIFKNILFIIFSTDEDIYNKLFKNKFKLSREELIDKLFKFIINKDYYLKNAKYSYVFNKLKLLCLKTKFYNLSFQGNFFLDFKNIFYYLIFSNEFNKKRYLLYFFKYLLVEILDLIKYIIFLPLNNNLNVKLSSTIFINIDERYEYLLISHLNDNINYDIHNYYEIKFKNNDFIFD